MKVAIVGTGAGWQDAPYKCPDWQIWVLCGHYSVATKFDRVYELHNAEAVKKGLESLPTDEAKKKFDWMKENVSVCHPSLKTTYPDARVIDFEGLINEYGPYFTSSVSWMIAEAIDEGATDIGLWGITMSSQNEYSHQKPSASYLLGWARAKGIRIHLSKACELMSAPFIYGYEEAPDWIKSLQDRKKRAKQLMDKHHNQLKESENAFQQMIGYTQCIEELENNFYGASRHD